MNTQNLEVYIKRCNLLKGFRDNLKTHSNVGLKLDCAYFDNELDNLTVGFIKNEFISLLNKKIKELEEKIKSEIG